MNNNTSQQQAATNKSPCKIQCIPILLTELLNDCLLQHDFMFGDLPDLSVDDNQLTFTLECDDRHALTTFVQGDISLLKQAITGLLDDTLLCRYAIKGKPAKSHLRASLTKTDDNSVTITCYHDNLTDTARNESTSNNNPSSKKQPVTASLELPTVKPPQWFASQLILHPEASIAFLSDDNATYQQWKQLLRPHKSVTLRQFVRVDEFEQFVRRMETNRDTLLLLVDYYLPNDDSRNGLSLVKTLDISDHTVLLITEGDVQAESYITSKAAATGCRALPKHLLAKVPVTFGLTIL